MHKSVRIAVVLLAIVAGCTSEAEKQAQAQGAAAAAEATRREQAKQALIAHPGHYIEASGTEFFDKGIINSYRELTKVSLMNKAEFPVRNVKGSLEWLNENGDTVATVAFSVPGSIAAGDTKTFSKQAGTLTTTTIQTDAKKYRITITSLELL